MGIFKSLISKKTIQKMKKLTLMLSMLLIAGATFACDGDKKGTAKACCKKEASTAGAKKACCNKDEKQANAKKEESKATAKKS